MEEEFRDIIGHEGVYQISNLGRVKSLSRAIKNGEKSFYISREKFLKQTVGVDGYYRVRLLNVNFDKTIRIHRLIAIAFIPNLKNKPCINHKNGIKTDNRLENLEWCTYKENSVHAFETGLSKIRIGENSGRGKLTNLDILEIKKQYISKSKDFDHKALSIKFSVCKATIGRILRSETYKDSEIF